MDKKRGKRNFNKSYRKAVFVVVYKKEKTKRVYVLLKRKKHWKGWEFPKGGIEKGETMISAVKREVKEETGNKSFNIKKYNVHGKYLYPKLLDDRPNSLGQTYNLFSAEIKGKIKIDKKEHSYFKCLEFDKAVKLLKWSNQKKCLKVVNNKLNKLKIGK